MKSYQYIQEFTILKNKDNFTDSLEKILINRPFAYSIPSMIQEVITILDHSCFVNNSNSL